MKCKILHEGKGRIRIHAVNPMMTLEEADILEYYMRNVEGVLDVKVHDRTGNAIITYSCQRETILEALSLFSYDDAVARDLVPEFTGRALNRSYEDKLIVAVLVRSLARFIFPAPIGKAVTLIRAMIYIMKGIKKLKKGKVDVEVLDATAITVSLIRGDYKTAASIMFLLNVGGILEEWTQKKSVDDLARAMSLNVDKVWKRDEGGDVLVSIKEIGVGDRIVVGTGNLIPLDGKVVEGIGTVNQSSITGESIPVNKETGSYVYAGTVVEEGECIVAVDRLSGGGMYDKIVKMIEDSEKLKSATEGRAADLADRLVPFTLGGTVLAYGVTQDVTKALSILMVDFSCALKLAMPISVLSAIKESSYHNICVKGGRFLEAVAAADTIVFDKTGTLTHATPRVADVVAFNGNDPAEMLRNAACLEEHYPHSMANAVVAEAKARGLKHEERHAKVEYVVAHGISSMLDGKKIVIGSHHFIFQDEGCRIPEGEQEKFDNLPSEYSHLYMAMDGVVSAVICISDPVRIEARKVIEELRKSGINKIIMMTGDNERTAQAVADEIGVDQYYSEVLPEDKAFYVEAEKAAGRKVIMIGDGVNDSPALSAADVGIAISDGAAIAREIADITISADDLYSLVTLREISRRLMKRTKHNYRFIVSFNMALMALGLGGVISPVASSLLHNISTVGTGFQNMTNLLD